MFQPKTIVTVAVLLSALNASAIAGSKLDKEAKKRDPTCRLVNQAYQDSRNSAVYREVTSVVEATGSRIIIDTRITGQGAFVKWAAQNRWTRLDRPPPAVTDPPRFKYCVYVDGIDGPHFNALWNDPPRTAYAEVWLARDYKNWLRYAVIFLKPTNSSLEKFSLGFSNMAPRT